MKFVCGEVGMALSQEPRASHGAPKGMGNGEEVPHPWGQGRDGANPPLEPIPEEKELLCCRQEAPEGSWKTNPAREYHRARVSLNKLFSTASQRCCLSPYYSLCHMQLIIHPLSGLLWEGTGICSGCFCPSGIELLAIIPVGLGSWQGRDTGHAPEEAKREKIWLQMLK